MSDERVSQKDIVNEWLALNGGQIPNTEKAVLYASLMELWTGFKNCGYSKDDIAGDTMTRVMNLSHNPNHKDGNKRTTWKRIATECIEGSMAQVWPNTKIKFESIAPKEQKKRETSPIPEIPEEGQQADLSVFKDLPENDIADDLLSTMDLGDE